MQTPKPKQKRNTSDPLMRSVKRSARSARAGGSAVTNSLFSFSFFKLALTGGVVLGFTALFFISGVFGGTKIGLTLNTNPVLERGLIGHWSFDGKDLLQNVRDRSGQGNNGNLFGFTSTTTVLGRIGQALRFDGSDDYIDIGDIGATTKSVAFWINSNQSSQDILKFAGTAGSPDSVTFVDKDIVTSTASADCAMTIPAGGVADDFMVVFAYNSENAAAKVWDDDGGGGNGWTQLDYNRDTTGRDRETAIYYKKHDGSEPDPTFTIGGSSPTSCVLLLYRGVDTSTPFDVTYDTGTHHTAGNDDTTPTNDAITTATDNAMVVIFHAATHNDISAVGAPTGYTLREESLVPGSSHNHKQLFVAEKLITSATTETPGAWTHTSSPTGTAEYHVYTIALRPATGAEASTTGVLIDSSTASTSGITNPTFYVDGEVTTTLPTNEWHHVVITTDTAIDSSQTVIGKLSGYFEGILDDVRIYDRTLSARRVARLYQLGATTHINTTINTNPDLEDSLVAHYTFDGKHMDNGVEDRSGSGYTGVLTNFTSTTTVYGRIGQALDFDGSDDYINLGDQSGLEAFSGGATITAWIKPDTISGTHYILGKGAGTPYNFYAFDDIIRFDNTFLSAGVIQSTSNIAVGEWTFVTATTDGSTTRLFFNTVEEDSSAASWNRGNTNSTMIGAHSDGTNLFDGVIDDLRVYNKELSQGEITRLYQLGATTHVNTSINTNPDLENGLVGHWTFDGKDITVDQILDRSGQGNHGGFIGGATTTAGVYGRIGQALEFDGSNDYASLSSEPSVGSGSFTLSAWAYSDDISSFDSIFGAGIMRSTTGDNIGDFILSVFDTGDVAFYNWRNGGGSDLDGFTSVAGAFTENTWHHMVATWDGTNTKIYIDAVSGTLTAPDSTGNSWGTAHEIGRSYDLAGYYFNGKIDDTRIYNRALSAAEVQRLYDLGR